MSISYRPRPYAHAYQERTEHQHSPAPTAQASLPCIAEHDMHIACLGLGLTGAVSPCNLSLSDEEACER